MAFTAQPLKQEEFAMRIVKDLGQVTANENSTKKTRHAVFECTACKEHFKARATGAVARAQTSCQECTRNHKKTTLHPLYAIWNGIRQRCYNPKRKDYSRYGAIGVTMCDEWKNDAQAFIDWCLENGWHKSLVVDKDIKCRELGIEPAMYCRGTISFITTQENAEEATAKKVAQIDKDTLQEIKVFDSCVKAALSLGKSVTGKTSVSKCARGEQHTAFGYKWKYV